MIFYEKSTALPKIGQAKYLLPSQTIFNDPISYKKKALNKEN